jgi:hypothetical protein
MEKPAFTQEQRAYFRAANARRRRGERACAMCGAQIQAALAWQLYCSTRCKNRAVARAYRQRQRAQTDPTASRSYPPAGPSAPLTPGARVVLHQPVGDVQAGAQGTTLQLDGTHAVVEFGTERQPRQRRVPLTALQPAP